VASFGDRPGIYKREIEKLGHVMLYDAFDGAPYCEEASGGRVRFLDLTIPQYGIRQYDWIISMEVAEHIPEKYEAVYLDNIFRHTKEGIILIWAVPGQRGLSDINNKPI
jgi:tryptophanyl-tRNA synthetase